MTALLLRPARKLVQTLTARSPNQIALGFALGMMVGLVPKGNLIALALVTFLLAARVDLGAGTVAAFAFTWIGYLLDPVSHRIGLGLLGLQTLRPFWGRLYDLPLAPWTAFNNTVVLGSLVLGLALFYPTYRTARLFAQWAMPRLVEWLRRYSLGTVLLGEAIAANRGQS